MSFPAPSLKGPLADPLIRGKVAMMANTFRTGLEGKLMFARDLEMAISAKRNAPMLPDGLFKLDHLVEAAVFLDWSFFGRVSAENTVARINAAVRRGMMA